MTGDVVSIIVPSVTLLVNLLCLAVQVKQYTAEWKRNKRKEIKKEPPTYEGRWLTIVMTCYQANGVVEYSVIHYYYVIMD